MPGSFQRTGAEGYSLSNGLLGGTVLLFLLFLNLEVLLVWYVYGFV